VAAAQPPARLFDDNFLRFLPSPLREPRRVWLAIPTGWALSIIGSLALAALVALVAPALKGPEFDDKGWVTLFALVVFAPVGETLIMAGLIWLFEKFLSTTGAIIASSVAWGALHSSMAGAWGLVIWWPFLIFSTLYVVWRQRGFWAGIGVAAATHALQNLGPALVIAFG
jgi:membrane protease YdiL (CAAX protease family)